MSTFNLQQLTAIYQLSKPAIERAKLCDVDNDTVIAHVEPRPITGATSLWDLGIVGGRGESQGNPDRHLYLVFVGLPHADVSTLLEDDWVPGMKLRFYLTDSLARMHPRKYFCKVHLHERQAREIPVRAATTSFVNDNINESFWRTSNYAEYYAQRWDSNDHTTSELRIVLPSYMMSFIGQALEMITCPIIPKAVQALLTDQGTKVSAIKQLELALGESIGVEKIFIHSSEEGENQRVRVDRGVRLYATAGNAAMPFGTMTNTNSPNFNINSITDAANKLAIENYMRLYPSWNSLTLSTCAPVRANAMNGTNTAAYVVNQKYDINDGEAVKRVFHIFAFPQHPINNHFRMLIHELVAKLPSEEAALVVWSQPPVTGRPTRITQRDMVDIITVHPASSTYIASKHKDMFICKKAAGQLHAKVEFVEGVFAAYSADFNRFQLAVADLADLPFGQDIQKK